MKKILLLIFIMSLFFTVPAGAGYIHMEPNDTNTITIKDVSAVLAKYTDFSVPVPPNTPEDVNADGAITTEDVALVLLNYIDFTISGEGAVNLQ